MDKQIEEMRNDLSNSWHSDIIIGDKFKDVAEKLTKLGYRKLPEGAVVLTSDQKIWLEHEWYKLGYKQGIKEMVEKLAKKLKDETGHWDNGWHIKRKIDEICKELVDE